MRPVAGLELLADAVLLSAVGYKYAWPANLHVLPTVHSSKRLERITKYDLRRMQAELLHMYYYSINAINRVLRSNIYYAN